MDKETLEKEYQPSLWTKRFASATEVLESHVNFCQTETNKNRTAIKCRLNIAYGDSEREKVDIYDGNLSSDAPLCIYIHGGYWQELNKNLSGFCVAPLIAAGNRVAVIGYDLCPNITLNNLVLQIQKAVNFLMEMATNAMDVKNVCIVGHSAGAHLAISLFTEQMYANLMYKHLIAGVHLISGVYDLLELRTLNAANPNNILSLTEDNVRDLSPLFGSYSTLAKSTTRIYVYTAGTESSRFIRQSQEISEHLQRENVRTDFLMLEECDHFDIAEKLSQTDYEITKCLIQNLKQ